MKRLFIIAISLFFINGISQAQSLISPFAGSKHLGKYTTEFERFTLVNDGSKDKLLTVEGSIISNTYQKPKEKSSLEVFRSYEKELRAAGFEMLSNSPSVKQNQRVASKIYGNDFNAIQKRPYDKTDLVLLQQIQHFTDYYIAAKKSLSDRTYYVAIAISRYKDFYLVDELEVANMETGTVKISEELLKKKITAEGKYIIYSIYFDTGKAEILPTSNETLEVMSKYLKNVPNSSFYIVGHTDDTGNLANNMDLSQRRATEVVRALQVRYQIPQSQVEAKGVGPLAPINSNETVKGRNLNRRVELVLRLK